MDILKNVKIGKVSSRRDIMEYSLVPWVGLIILSLVIIYFNIKPKYEEWTRMKNKITVYDAQRSKIKNEIRANDERKRVRQGEYDNARREVQIIEDQRLPSKIDIHKLTRVLELYAIQLEVLDTETRDSIFRLDGLTFTKGVRKKDSSITSNPVKMSFVSDRENLNEFIWFLQKGVLAERLQEKIKYMYEIQDKIKVDPDSDLIDDDEGVDQIVLNEDTLGEDGEANSMILLEDIIWDAPELLFLDNNLLPLAHIDSINITPDKDDENILSVKLGVLFFSQ